jgi:hypothetical protein
VQGSCHSESEHDGREPSLGSSNFEVDQTHWAAGCDSRDREAQCEDEGFDSDSEPDTEADREPPCEPFTTGGELPI